MKEKLIRFMAGRYGFDSLGKATIIAALAAVVLASLLTFRFCPGWPGR